MLPTQDTSHVSEGQGLLTSMFVNKANVKGFVTALMLRIQELENSYWAFLNAVQLANHPMPGGPWNILDQLGYIVGVVRNGLDDADFLAMIKLKAKVNRARGRAEDVLSLAAMMSAPGQPVYLEAPIAAFYLGCWNIALNYPIFTPLLSQVRAAGVYGLFHFTTWADGNDFEFSSRYQPVLVGTPGAWGSRYDSTAGGLMVAAVAL